MKVSDFDIDWSSGRLYNCCWDDIQARENENAHEGMIIECNECGEKMILRKDNNGVLKWTHTK